MGIVAGVPLPFYGGGWPRIKDGVVGDLVLPAWAFVDAQDANLLTAPLVTPIIRKGERLLVGLRPSVKHDMPGSPGMDIRAFSPFEAFAEAHLAEELRLRLRCTSRSSTTAARTRR